MQDFLWTYNMHSQLPNLSQENAIRQWKVTLNMKLCFIKMSGGSIENERFLLWLDGVVWVHAHGVTQLDAEQLLLKYQDEVMA